MKSFKTGIVLGFSGSRRGLNSSQKTAVRFWVKAFKPRLGRHGLCVGADEVFDVICEAYGVPRKGSPCKPEGHALRSACRPQTIDPVAECLFRNVKILNGSDVNLICPRTESQEEGSGTWRFYKECWAFKRRFILITPTRQLRNFDVSTGEYLDRLIVLS